MEIQYHDDKTPFVVWDEKIIQLECEPLKEKYYLEKAKSELRETPENIERGLRELRELLKGKIKHILKTFWNKEITYL